MTDNSIDSIESSINKSPAVAIVDNSDPITKSSPSALNDISISLLEQVYKEARVRLQMCSSSLLFKFNDDDGSIFKQMKSELAQTYEQMKLNCT